MGQFIDKVQKFTALSLCMEPFDKFAKPKARVWDLAFHDAVLLDNLGIRWVMGLGATVIMLTAKTIVFLIIFVAHITNNL